jgi:hypothetical protein
MPLGRRERSRETSWSRVSRLTGNYPLGPPAHLAGSLACGGPRVTRFAQPPRALKNPAEGVSSRRQRHKTLPLGVEISNWRSWEQTLQVEVAAATVPSGGRGGNSSKWRSWGNSSKWKSWGQSLSDGTPKYRNLDSPHSAGKNRRAGQPLCRVNAWCFTKRSWRSSAQQEPLAPNHVFPRIPPGARSPALLQTYQIENHRPMQSTPPGRMAVEGAHGQATF